MSAALAGPITRPAKASAMDLLPILSTLRRHKTAAALIVLEVALSCAIICNAAFLIALRWQHLEQPTGLAEHELLVLRVSGRQGETDPQVQSRQDLAALRALPGVQAVTLINQVPFANSSSISSVNLVPDQPQPTLDAAFYSGDEHSLATLGLTLRAGRNVLPEEVQAQSAVQEASDPKIAAVLLTEHTARTLFPGRASLEEILGQAIHVFGPHPTRVVGIVADLPQVHPSLGGGDTAHAMLMPVQPDHTQGFYVLRADPARLDEVLRAAAQALERAGPQRLIAQQSRLDDLRQAYYRQDRAMVRLLVGVCVALLVVTALGIVGLASFWVQQRTRMIGIRRALGATRGQILRYFQAENFLLSSAGIVLGCLGAFGISALLMAHYELPRLPLHYLPIGAGLLWLLGQLAVLAPARRAAALPPVVVMRGG